MTEVKREVSTEKGIKFTKPPAQVKAPFAGREEEELAEPLPPRGGNRGRRKSNEGRQSATAPGSY